MTGAQPSSISGPRGVSLHARELPVLQRIAGRVSGLDQWFASSASTQKTNAQAQSISSAPLESDTRLTRIPAAVSLRWPCQLEVAVDGHHDTVGPNQPRQGHTQDGRAGRWRVLPVTLASDAQGQEVGRDLAPLKPYGWRRRCVGLSRRADTPFSGHRVPHFQQMGNRVFRRPWSATELAGWFWASWRISLRSGERSPREWQRLPGRTAESPLGRR